MPTLGYPGCNSETMEYIEQEPCPPGGR
jgi:hypothetical protein